MTALGPGMSDRDPVTTWADITPKPRSEPLELTRARTAKEEAWQQYDAALDRDATQEVLFFQNHQARLYERRYNELYFRLYSQPSPETIQQAYRERCAYMNDGILDDERPLPFDKASDFVPTEKAGENE